MPVLKPRILLIEDSAHRIERFRKWLCGTEFELIEASSGGRAMGILRKGGMDSIAGLCLDHDLHEQPVTVDDMSLSTSNLMNSIVLSVPRSIPILVHSMNVSKPPQMVRRLQAEGYSVTRIPMIVLTRNNFHKWLQDVRDNWEE